MLTKQAFARLVAEDVKKTTDEDQRTYLRTAEMRETWRNGLYLLLEDVDAQLDVVDAEHAREVQRYTDMGDHGKVLLFEETLNYNNGRKKTERFRFYVEQKLVECDRLIALSDSETSLDLSLAAFLRKAIETHRAKLQQLDMEETPVDEALYRALDGAWVFDEIE